jgi:hypothetical protein
MSNPKNALQERLAKFKGEHSIVYSDVTSAGFTFQCTLSATLTWQGVTKQWTATSLRSRCSKKESHFETAELLLQDKDLLLHCNVANWDVPGGSHEQITRPVTFASGMSGNFKTRLNELAMKARVECRYETTSMAPFLSRITIDRPSTEESITITGAEAGTKKAAEQSAAARALNDAGVRAMLGIEESLGPAVNAVGGADNTHNVEGYLKRPVPTRSVLDSAADVYVDTAAELVSASATASPEPAQLVQPPPGSPQQLPHNTASATAVQPHPSTLTNPKGHLLELFAKNLTRLVALPGAMHKSPVFSTSASAPFVATVTIGTPQGDIVLVGPACTTKKAAEQAAAALALADTRVRALLYLPPLQPCSAPRFVAERAIPGEGAEPTMSTAPEPTPAQEDTVPVEQECKPVVPDAQLSYPALSQHSTDDQSGNTTIGTTTTVVADTTVMPSTALASTTVTTNPKGRLLEMSAQAGLGLTRGPQFTCTATAPFVATISIGSPQGTIVLTGPGCGTKKAAEQAVAALALADTRVTQLLHPPARVPNTEAVAPEAFSVTPSYVSENSSGPVPMAPLNCVTNPKGRLLELCAKLPLPNRCQAQFQTTVTAPFVSTLVLIPHNVAITGPGCTTKKSAEQAVAAIALQDASIQRLLGLASAPAVATEDDVVRGTVKNSDDVGLHNN